MKTMTDEAIRIVQEIAAAYDEIRATFSGNVRCALLKRDAGDGNAPFAVFFEILGGWFPAKTEFRGVRDLTVATSAEDFGEKLAVADAVAIGNEVFEIDRGTISPPLGEDLFWVARCSRTGERFEIP